MCAGSPTSVATSCLVEAGGIEPPSESAYKRPSTRVVGRFYSRDRRRATGYGGAIPSLVSRRAGGSGRALSLIFGQETQRRGRASGLWGA